MKYLILLAFLSAGASADYYNCPNSVLKNKKASAALQFLQKIAGRYQIGKCFVQLQMCEEDGTPADDSVVGDLLVTDRHGRSFYVQLDFAQTDTDETQHLILIGHRMVHYESMSEIPAQDTGKDESYRLEIIKEPDEQNPSRLELGIFTSRLSQLFPFIPPGKSYWVICQK